MFRSPADGYAAKITAPEKPGLYFARVTARGEEIAGSPFAVTVVAPVAATVAAATSGKGDGARKQQDSEPEDPKAVFGAADYTEPADPAGDAAARTVCCPHCKAHMTLYLARIGRHIIGQHHVVGLSI